MANPKDPIKLRIDDDEMKQFTISFASRFNYSMQARECLPEVPLTNIFITRLFGRLNN
jgi:hypothetical protein